MKIRAAVGSTKSDDKGATNTNEKNAGTPSDDAAARNPPFMDNLKEDYYSMAIQRDANALKKSVEKIHQDDFDSDEATKLAQEIKTNLKKLESSLKRRFEKEPNTLAYRCKKVGMQIFGIWFLGSFILCLIQFIILVAMEFISVLSSVIILVLTIFIGVIDLVQKLC